MLLKVRLHWITNTGVLRLRELAHAAHRKDNEIFYHLSFACAKKKTATYLF
jgi:hypothetical protein